VSKPVPPMAPMGTPDQLLTLPEVAARLACSPGMLRRLGTRRTLSPCPNTTPGHKSRPGPALGRTEAVSRWWFRGTPTPQYAAIPEPVSSVGALAKLVWFRVPQPALVRLADIGGLARLPGEPGASQATPDISGQTPKPARRPRIGRSTLGEPVAQVRGMLAERVVVSTELDPFLSLRGLAAYSGIGIRKLRDHLNDPVHPLPHYRLPGGAKGKGKVLVRRSEFDAWISRYHRVGNPDVDRIVAEALLDVRLA
jgi:hypothetical protein